MSLLIDFPAEAVVLRRNVQSIDSCMLWTLPPSQVYYNINYCLFTKVPRNSPS